MPIIHPTQKSEASFFRILQLRSCLVVTMLTILQVDLPVVVGGNRPLLTLTPYPSHNLLDVFLINKENISKVKRDKVSRLEAGRPGEWVRVVGGKLGFVRTMEILISQLRLDFVLVDVLSGISCKIPLHMSGNPLPRLLIGFKHRLSCPDDQLEALASPGDRPIALLVQPSLLLPFDCHILTFGSLNEPPDCCS